MAPRSHLERTVRDQLYTVSQGNGTPGGALSAGVDDGLDGAVDLGQGNLETIVYNNKNVA